MHELNIGQITIIGTGLLGGSIGLALRKAGYGGRIIGVGRREATLRQAERMGCIDRGTIDLAEGAAEADLIVLATPVAIIPRQLEQLAKLATDSAVITDVGSTKQQIVAAAERHLRRPERFIGAHPMAGSERKGPEGADADLFRGKPCILTPTDRADPEALRRVGALWRSLGMEVIRMSAEQHDLQTAVISHLPHAAAVLLVLTAIEQGGWEIASTGFRDTTRLASSNPPMRADIMLANRRRLLSAIETFRGKLEELRELLETADEAGLLERLERAREARDDWLAARSRQSSRP